MILPRIFPKPLTRYDLSNRALLNFVHKNFFLILGAIPIFAPVELDRSN
jgi:hypothetical protein